MLHALPCCASALAVAQPPAAGKLAERSSGRPARGGATSERRGAACTRGKGGRRDGGAAGAAWSYDLWLLALPPALVTAFPGASTTEPVPELGFQHVWQSSSRSRFWSCSRSPAKRALRILSEVYDPGAKLHALTPAG